MYAPLAPQPAAADSPLDVGTWRCLQPFELECVESIELDHLGAQREESKRESVHRARGRGERGVRRARGR